MTNEALEARKLLYSESVGVLSTHSTDIPGYPFGSITPFTLNHQGEPVILISDIAQHTRNIKADNKISLTVFDQYASDPQSAGRITWIGDAEPIDETDSRARERYLRYFPAAASYFDTHDFSFYRLNLKRARFIGGFGRIYWIDPPDMLRMNPFRETEGDIIEHMNNDHGEALLHYANVIKKVNVQDIAMTGIDGDGFDMRGDGRKLRIDFESPISTVEEARAVLIRLARTQQAGSTP
ncbi:MAG: heme iron utilization protein [Blastocatellia bacterium AA13]|nr:MAG: heme iron utilization protein [Blastocatellia bacterium AA13]